MNKNLEYIIGNAIIKPVKFNSLDKAKLYLKSEGYCCESEPELGKADTYDGFRDQLDELQESKWVELYELMYETKCPKLLAFFEGLELVSDDG